MLQGVKDRCEAMAANDANMEAKANEKMKRAAAAGMTVEKYMWMLEDEKRERAALQQETEYGRRMRLKQELEEQEGDAFIFDDEAALTAFGLKPGAFNLKPATFARQESVDIDGSAW
jgi:hypothetical protein